MTVLQEPIIVKLKDFSISNLSDVMFLFSEVSPNLLETKDNNFVSKL